MATRMNETSLPQAPDFDFVRPIGEGGFGQVWLAINRTTGQPRAVKVIARARAAGRDPAGREIASLTRLEANLCRRHPNLLAIHHVGETAEHLFYVMDLADDLSGQSDPTGPDYRPATLENLLAAGPIDAADCARYARQLLAGLASLHEAGMVHRDVKPANCLFLGGELKLGDFGLLTAADLSASRLGTLRYMPPDGCMDARADVYAAGLVIYEMLTGLGAERFPSLGQRTQAIAADRRLATLNRLALRACDPDPSRRFRDAREMLAELTAAERLPAKRRRRRRLWLATGMALGAAVALFYLWPAGTVSVNFVSDPFEATIYVDGQLLRAPDGSPYRTPCTVSGFTAETHSVVFQWDADSDPFHVAGPDGKLDAGQIDFSAKREITGRCKAEH
jgi:eukaryotic-like serine/threonine-protein kinase